MKMSNKAAAAVVSRGVLSLAYLVTEKSITRQQARDLVHCTTVGYAPSLRADIMLQIEAA